DLLHIGPGYVCGTVSLAPAGGVNALHPVIPRVAVCVRDRDRVPDPDPAERGLELVLLPDSWIACHGLPDDDLARVTVTQVITGDHFRVEWGDILLVIGHDRPHRDPENTLAIREG